MKKIYFKKAVSSFAIVAILVLISLILTKNSMQFYKNLAKPDLAPPPIIFPIVWTILYSVITITLYRFYDNKDIKKIIIINLIINIIWPILFFRFELLFLSIIWLILLIVSTLVMLLKLFKEDKIYTFLNLPYLLWTFFALYLNIIIFVLN